MRVKENDCLRKMFSKKGGGCVKKLKYMFTKGNWSQVLRSSGVPRFLKKVLYINEV